MLPKLPNGKIDWSKMTPEQVYQWLEKMEDMAPGHALIEQASIHAYLGGLYGKVQQELLAVDHYKGELEKRRDLHVQLIKAAQDETMNVSYALAIERARDRLIKELGSKPAQGTLDAEAKADAEYRATCERARDARVEALSSKELDECIVKLARLTGQKEQLRILLAALDSRREGLKSLAYARSKEE